MPEPFVTEADLPEFRAMADQLRRELEAVRGTARQVPLTAGDIVDLNLEIEAVRSGILGRYRTTGEVRRCDRARGQALPRQGVAARS